MDNQYPGTNVPTKLIVHHTAYPGSEPQFDLVNGWHKDRGFPLSTLGFYVGYQYFIEKDGTTRQARADTEGGAHTIGENWQSIGICLAGDFSKESPTSDQVESLCTLMDKLCTEHNLDRKQIFPHRHFNDTDCYGSNLKDDWAQVLMEPTLTFAERELEYMLDKQANI